MMNKGLKQAVERFDERYGLRHQYPKEVKEMVAKCKFIEDKHLMITKYEINKHEVYMAHTPNLFNDEW